MKHCYNFYKEELTWYIDLPSWPGDQADLAMVLGADVMLDRLSHNGNFVRLEFADEKISDNVLIKDVDLELIPTDLKETAKEMGGAFYKDNDLSVWLCDVTKFVFGTMPEKIWYKAV